ncbi:MAG: YhbD family protein [Coriobacteriales bacterium]|nr:YhbD family protein [Coriobacteriales bacterium]
MDEISKKDLLTETGISYGQLYRWKREGLIPEEWFVKRSAFTGQETFFPRARVLERVRAILALKDELSLDQIRERLGNLPPLCDVRKTLLAATNGDENFVDALKQPTRHKKLPLPVLAAALGLYEWLLEAQIPRAEQLRLIDEALKLGASSPTGALPAAITLFKAGKGQSAAYHLCLSANAEAPRFDNGIKVLTHREVEAIIEQKRSEILGQHPDETT